ncbi:DMT family transporter [Serinicoccus kebangsaanensis]|uniref:DMT family transporter n=1 Tax=Serinicoccus kebangsaanensis TaxID=2602069 RepID=UPI00124D0C3F|nr:DMT family transporter [Serinicoccus kebangsaanensis]
MGLLLALGAAVAYGLSDFVGGVASRRSSPWPVAVMCAVGGLLGAIAIAVLTSGDPTAPDLAWGALAGVGSGLGGAFLYRGLATGRMGVVAPISAVGAAVLPVAVALVSGERPGVLVWCGIVAALPGIWLVSREPGHGRRLAGGILDGALAGLGFGLLFAAIGQVPDGAGYWPLAVTQAFALVSVILAASLLRGSWRPRTRVEVGGGLLAGVLATLAALGFLLSTQAGLMTVAAVLTSLYPAVTVLLAAAVLRERIGTGQGVGLAFCALCVGLVAAG